jgi:hypothetical protein
VHVAVGLLEHKGVIESKFDEQQRSEGVPKYATKCDVDFPIEVYEGCSIIGFSGVEPSILLLGDSHGAAFKASLSEALYQEKRVPM